MLPSFLLTLVSGLRKPVAARLRDGYAPHPLTSDDAAALWRLALKHSGLSSKEAAHAMGYESPSVVSRWSSGVEPVQFARVIAVPQLRRGLLLALADSGDSGVRLERVVQVQVPA